MSEDPLVNAWIELQLAEPATATYEGLWWSFEAVDQLTDTDPDKAMQFVLSVLSSTDSEWVLGNLAAGPLEDLLVRHPEPTIAALERNCPNNARLGTLLHGVWRNNLSGDLWGRLEVLRDLAVAPPNNSLQRDRDG